MKKFLFLFVMSLFCAMSLSAWEHSAGLELSAPFFSVNAKDDGTKNVIEPQGKLRYFGRASNGFCLSAELGAGGAFSKNFSLENEDATAKGFGMTLAFGAGYAFDIGERWTLAALGSLSLDWLRFKYKKEISASLSSGKATAEWTQTDNALFAGIGLELFAMFRLTNNISLAASFAARFIDGGSLWKSGTNIGNDYDETYDLRGNFSLVPSFGATWTF